MLWPKLEYGFAFRNLTLLSVTLLSFMNVLIVDRTCIDISSDWSMSLKKELVIKWFFKKLNA